MAGREISLLFFETNMKFYKEKYVDKNIVERIFESNEFNSYPWHRDAEGREIIVIKSDESWFFQIDNHLPVALTPGKSIKIPKGQFHRLIMGKGKLVLKIIKADEI